MSRILALDGASAGWAGFGLIERQTDELHLAFSHREQGQGAAVRLPAAIAAALDALGWRGARLDLIVVLVGPGSFTGLRASLALAHGMALGAASDVIGVTLGESLAYRLQAAASAGPVWCATQARRDRVFIETVSPGGVVGAPVAYALAELPDPDGIPTLAGDARAVAGAVLSARGRSWIAGPSGPAPEDIVRAALQRRGAGLHPRAAQPLYVDPPEARLPAGPRMSR